MHSADIQYRSTDRKGENGTMTPMTEGGRSATAADMPHRENDPYDVEAVRAGITASLQRAGISATQLSARAGVSPRSLTAFLQQQTSPEERDPRGIQLDTLVRCASALGMTVSEFIGEANPSTTPAEQDQAAEELEHGFRALLADQMRASLRLEELLTRLRRRTGPR